MTVQLHKMLGSLEGPVMLNLLKYSYFIMRLIVIAVF